MEIKAEFLFIWEDKEICKIQRKCNKIVELPCMPKIGDAIEILSFKEFFGFTKNECSYFNDIGMLYVDDITIKYGRIVVWLDYDKP